MFLSVTRYRKRAQLSRRNNKGQKAVCVCVRLALLTLLTLTTESKFSSVFAGRVVWGAQTFYQITSFGCHSKTSFNKKKREI